MVDMVDVYTKGEKKTLLELASIGTKERREARALSLLR